MKGIKRILAFVLSFVMIFTSMPVIGHAANFGKIEVTKNVYPSEKAGTIEGIGDTLVTPIKDDFNITFNPTFYFDFDYAEIKCDNGSVIIYKDNITFQEIARKLSDKKIYPKDSLTIDAHFKRKMNIILDNSEPEKGTLTVSNDNPDLEERVTITATAKEGYSVQKIICNDIIPLADGFSYSQKGNNGEAIFNASRYNDDFSFKAIYEDIHTTQIEVNNLNPEYGTVQLSSSNVPFAKELTITTTPKEGYGTASIEFNGEIYNQETVTVKNTGWGTNKTVEVKFKPSATVITRTIYTQGLTNENCGTITINKEKLKPNEDLIIKCEPYDGYEFSHMEITTTEMGKIKYCYEKECTFSTDKVGNTVTVEAYFHNRAEHKITYELNYEDGATVYVRKESDNYFGLSYNSANHGEKIKFQIEPKPGYTFEYLSYDLGFGPLYYTHTNFEMPDRDIHVIITLEKERYDAHYFVTDDNGDKFSPYISITGQNSYCIGDTVKLTVQNYDYKDTYRYEGLYVYSKSNGKLIASSTEPTITFIMPASEINVYATYHKRQVCTLGFYVQEGRGRMEFEGYNFYEENRLTQALEDNLIKCKVIPEDGYRLVKADICFSTVPQESKTEKEFSFTMPNEKVIINLKFEQIQTYTVSFIPNDGVGTMNPIENIEKGTTIKVPECKFTRGDFVFEGWTINNCLVQPNDEIIVNSDIKLVAKWHLPEYSIFIDCNEGGTIATTAWQVSEKEYVAAEGDEIMLAVVPNITEGYDYVLGTLELLDAPEIKFDGNGFTMPNHNVTLKCEFVNITCHHTHITKKDGTPATCTEDGLDTKITCNDCGRVFQNVIPATGHKWDDGEITTPATCFQNGEITYHCLNEGCTEIKTKIIPMIICKHTTTNTIPEISATCTEDGLAKIVCADCNLLFDTITIPATGHKWDEGKVTKDATDDENGEILYTCTNDGCNETKTETIPMHVCEHENTEVIPGKVATCIEEGLTDGLKCTRCGKVIKEQETISKLDHKWDEGTIIKPATTTETGIKEYKCTNHDCRETKIENLPKLGGGSSGGGSGSGSGSGAGGGGSTLPDDKLPQGLNKDIILFLDSYKMIIFGVEKENDVMPIVRNDRTMLPIRVIAENLGAKVEWDEKEPSIVKITKGDKVITITLGSNIAKVNDKEYELDSVAFAENNRTYMPVRFIAENLDATVTWDEKDPNKVIITAK